MRKFTAGLCGVALALTSGTIPAQGFTIGAAPTGDAAAVAAKVIKDAEHPCPKVTSASRVADGSITAKCSNGETYRVMTVQKQPVAMNCNAAKAFGIKGC